MSSKYTVLHTFEIINQKIYLLTSIDLPLYLKFTSYTSTNRNNLKIFQWRLQNWSDEKTREKL